MFLGDLLLVLLFSLIITSSCVDRIINKRLVLKKKCSSFAFNVSNMFLSSIFAILFLFVLNGFKLNFNLPTFYYSLAYTLAVMISLSSIIALKYVSLSIFALFATAGGVIVPSIFGYVFLQEQFVLGKIIGVILLFIAVLLPSISKIKEDNRSSKIGFLLCVLVFFNSGLSSIISKLFGMSALVTDEKSMFILTNMNLFVIMGLIVIASLIKNRKKQ